MTSIKDLKDIVITTLNTETNDQKCDMKIVY